jgi:uncharacterized phage-associated protein
MANVNDIAAAILQRQGAMSTWKLQKLVYYCQAWHAVWEDEALFDEPIQAWANGPVVRSLYDQHRGLFNVSGWRTGDPSRLTEQESTSIDAVLRTYGAMSGADLSALTHREPPWRDARAGLPEGERGNATVPLDAMAEYYGSLI